MKPTFRLGPSPQRPKLGIESLAKHHACPKLERLLSDCFELLDKEASALASEDLERISEVLEDSNLAGIP